MATRGLPRKRCYVSVETLNQSCKNDVPHFYSMHNDQPIDLTQSSSKKHVPGTKTKHCVVQSQIHGLNPNSTDEDLPDAVSLQRLVKNVIDLNSVDKQEELLKAAKSLFIKRTSTLYHWLYPNIPKLHLKTTVSNIWENLKLEEKQVYISQVLVKFGYGSTNLMVNPQLDNFTKIRKFSSRSTDCKLSSELQSAILSITESTSRNKDYNGTRRKYKRRSENVFVFNRVRSINSFQDDPELSAELARFDSSYDYF